MNPRARFTAMVTALVLLFAATPSWSQPVCSPPGCNPTASDANNNTAGGTGALINVGVSGRVNTAFGYHALFSNTTGTSNTASGAGALLNNTTGSANTAIGFQALIGNSTGGANTATGYFALLSNETGSRNTATGHFALWGNDTGDDNTATGVAALGSNTTGSGNTASGAAALGNNTTGFNNTATGFHALLTNSVGSDNTATGGGALAVNTTGSRNTASGSAALNANRIGDDNTAIGNYALLRSAGHRNIAVGSESLSGIMTGNRNIAIGYQAGANLTSGNNNIYIANAGRANESQTVRVGTAQTRTFIAGINAASVSDAQVMVDTITGQLGIVTSSARYKQDIETMASRSEGLLKLRPVTFAYKDDVSAAPHYGLIAEEVATVYPELVTRTATGEVQAVRYQELIPMLLNELQRQRQEFQQALEVQRQELGELRALVRPASHERPMVDSK